MSQEEGNGHAEGSRSSDSAGRKRRSRFSTASTAIMNPSPTETDRSDASASTSNPPSGSRPDDYPMQEENTRRATRLLAEFRNGFRRSVMAAEHDSNKPNEDASQLLPEQDALGMSVNRSDQVRTPLETTQASDDVLRQDKKRRRIGEYAGAKNAMDTDDAGAPSGDFNIDDPTTSTSNTGRKATTPPLASPALVPLTDTDPLLDDRLRTVEAIRSVLGDDVARRLPSVESLRELARSQTIVEDAQETAGPSVHDPPSGPSEDNHPRRSSRISLPPSTVELLDRLDQSSQSSGVAESSVPTTVTASNTGPSTQPSTLREDRRARRTSIRNFTNRLSGWLGVAPSRGESTREEDAPGDLSESETQDATGTLLPEISTAADRTGELAEEAAPAPSNTNRLATGAVMIVQGFVQTTIPVRERRRRTPAPTSSDAERSQTGVSASRLAPRRSMSQPASPSIAPSITPSQFSREVALPQTETRLQTPDDLTTAGATEDRRASQATSPSGGQAVAPGQVVGPETIQHAVGDSEDSALMPSLSEEPSRPSPASVATAATATSLLSHGSQAGTPTEAPVESGSLPNRASGPRAALEALRNRLRVSGRTGSSRDGRSPDDTSTAGANRGVEDVLREYMRHAMASSRNTSRLSEADGSDRPPPLSTLLPTTDPASFEAFLNDMQTSLIEALSAFVEGSDAEIDGGDHASSNPRETAPSTPAASAETSPSNNAEATPSSSTSTALPTEATSPRRLNFFRLFQFPPRRNAPENPSDPAVDLIPVVIVGVRSMSGSINSLTAQNVAAAPFPFNPTDDIQGPAATEEGERASPTNEVAEVAPQDRQAAPAIAHSEEASRAAGSWGSRALRSINRLRRPRSAALNTDVTETDEAFTRNYVLWVVGGNYPAGHPILTIPHLFTGELSHEDLWILAEALGQAKPPVATKTDIANSGLVVIKSHQVRGEGEAGAILASSVDQCLICLGDYADEDETDVRVMKCKHAYHKDCIDHWLEVGRNSCPACRQAGVERASDRPPEPAPAETARPDQDEDVNMAT
ncbi:hypothetical protein NliqN6_2526 [Naganishia liquefaciens]|uniref:RING-type domain-containing protein n=1 Tax=Naganishia liquefaciens TaxID=104408 RepID=A0A8H3YE64_9TREE|nr:hypothetical protein NliqN6_2526 [Naganishia liquefaciens]